MPQGARTCPTYTSRRQAGRGAEVGARWHLFFVDSQRCYERWDSQTPPDLRLVARGDLPSTSAYGIEDTEEFEGAAIGRFGVDLRYDADRYLDLLNTFSNHRPLSTTQREGLFACLRRRIAREPGGTVFRSAVAFELSTALRRPA